MSTKASQEDTEMMQILLFGAYKSDELHLQTQLPSSESTFRLNAMRG